MLALKIAYSARNSSGRIYPSLMLSRNSQTLTHTTSKFSSILDACSKGGRLQDVLSSDSDRLQKQVRESAKRHILIRAYNEKVDTDNVFSLVLEHVSLLWPTMSDLQLFLEWI